MIDMPQPKPASCSEVSSQSSRVDQRLEDVGEDAASSKQPLCLDRVVAAVTEGVAAQQAPSG
jgi:hypothetical protein